MNKMLCIILTISALPLICSPRALSQITPLPAENPGSNAYCTYDRLDNLCCKNKCLERCESTCSSSYCDYASYYASLCFRKSYWCALSLLSLPLTCIKDTCCLPCDRNQTPPECYPDSRMACYFLSCEILQPSHNRK